ncbi:protein yippee-like At5g53940 isoform X1 [Camellia sinensis]|uniref:protein yippee-like At5g53940 isoform X1 n=1 Tax=Camellia sinensis TaxID=4442 RepID=UPI0010366495|nr:protein yippee-like At5g53940 isoform X1 [Camellia sinensis]
MGRVFVVEVEGRSYRCRYCHTSLALTEDVLSRGSIKGALHHICNNLGLQCTILCALPTTSNAHAHTRTSTWEVPKSILALLVPLLLCHTSLYGTMSFSCNHGKAYLVHKVVNITVGPVEERIMFTGTHTVSDIFCCCCGQILGWKYVTAHDKAQKYKEGKYVLERWRIVEEGIDEVNADARLSLSDAENA